MSKTRHRRTEAHHTVVNVSKLLKILPEGVIINVTLQHHAPDISRHEIASSACMTWQHQQQLPAFQPRMRANHTTLETQRAGTNTASTHAEGRSMHDSMQ